MSSTVQPKEVIERLFARFSLLYGARLTREWLGNAAEDVKRTWARELAGIPERDLIRGMESLRLHERFRDWIPNAMQFAALCRPVMDPDAAFFEATRLWPSRTGWSNPAIYWAALSIGNAVRSQPYAAIKAAWREAYMRALENPKPLPAEAPQPKLEARKATKEEIDAAAERVLAKYRKPLPSHYSPQEPKP
jgi:hypothetical protein